MKKKIIYGILILIIIAGAIVAGTIKFKKGTIYSNNIKIDIYLGKTFENEDIKKIAQEVFETNNIIVKKIEYYEDMFSIILKQEDVENINEKVEQLNTKINEKYEIENSVEDINVVYQPAVRLRTLVIPYILPTAISISIILIYALIRFRKLGIIKTLITYILSIILSQALYLSIIAIARIPVNRLIVPIGLIIYVAVITAITMLKERKLAKYKLEKEQK